MKKAVGIFIFVLLAVAAGFLAMMGFRGQPVSAQALISEDSAKALREKLATVKKPVEAPGQRPAGRFEATEAELESYVLLDLQHDIPGHLEAIDVQLAPGTVAADVKVTLPPNATRNVAIDALLGGTHTLFVKGSLKAENSSGQFKLEETRLDGIPVPPILIESLLSRFVKPRYPDVDLAEPFVLPWGVKSVVISTGKVAVEY